MSREMTDDDVLVLTNEEFKKCSCCGRWLPLEEFHNKRESKDNKQAYCKECEKKYKHSRPQPRSNTHLLVKLLNYGLNGLTRKDKDKLIDIINETTNQKTK